MTTAAKLRQTFIDYFVNQGHTHVTSSSLVPTNDPTLLFTNAGMVQFKELFLGLEKRAYTRATTTQRCIRAGGKHNDLENVGYTARHHTFFEMLGNFSFGDYFKHDAIPLAWHFLTQVLALPPEKLWVTVHEDDTEAAHIWLNEIGVNPQRFSYLGAKDNFWSMGDTGPCGPCSEIFYDHGDSVPGGPPGSVDADGDRYIEIWNLVFMEFERSADGKLSSLPKPSVDTGMGLERLAAVMQGVHNNYDTDLFIPLLDAIVALARLPDRQNTSARVIADHIRSCAFLIADGIYPSNEGRGYVLRRIIRRAVRHGHHLGLREPFFYQLVATLIQVMGGAYPELAHARDRIETTLRQEEIQFSKTLEQGFQLFNEMTANLSDQRIPGSVVFKLYDTYGFPLDLTADMARERGLTLDTEGFEQAMAKQRNQSKVHSQFQADYAGALALDETSLFIGYETLEQDAQITAIFVDQAPIKTLHIGQNATLALNHTPFYAESGGQVGDQGIIQTTNGWFEVHNTQKQGQAILHIGELKGGQLSVGESVQAKVNTGKRAATACNHSATHLLHAALKQQLGSHVQQKGSRVEPERLRFDFAHFAPLTEAELHSIETIVNAHIRQNHLADTHIMPIEAAMQSGAAALFGEKYGDEVRVLHLGDFSKELCGGTHVNRTGDIGLFKIISETGIAAGIRRIEALTGQVALEWVEKNETLLKQIMQPLKGDRDSVVEKLHQLLDKYRLSEKKNAELERQTSRARLEKINVQPIHGISVLATRFEGFDAPTLRSLVDELKSKYTPAVIVLAGVKGDKVQLIASVSVDPKLTTIDARELIQRVGEPLGIKGGGRKDMAQAGGIVTLDNLPKLSPPNLEDKVYSWVKHQLADSQSTSKPEIMD